MCDEIKTPEVHRARLGDIGEDLDIERSNLVKFANKMIFLKFPVVASLTLQSIENELDEAVQSKAKTLQTLTDKYAIVQAKSVNIVQDVIVDDFEMAIDGNVKLIPDAYASLMRSSKKCDLIQLLIKNVSRTGGGNGNNNNESRFEKTLQKIYNLLRYSCEYKFPRLDAEDDNKLNRRYVQVWTIFQQYFKQFDYLDYLDNFVLIKKGVHDIKSLFAIIRILLEIGPIVC